MFVVIAVSFHTLSSLFHVSHIVIVVMFMFIVVGLSCSFVVTFRSSFVVMFNPKAAVQPTQVFDSQ